MHIIALLRVVILKSRQGLRVESFLPGTALSMDHGQEMPPAWQAVTENKCPTQKGKIRCIG
jgi:hypothetical protein